MNNEYDGAVVKCFLKNQHKMFAKSVADNEDEARDFLEEALAVVLEDISEVMEYLDSQGFDVEWMTEDDLLEADEVFEVGDGRYLVVEG